MFALGDVCRGRPGGMRRGPTALQASARSSPRGHSGCVRRDKLWWKRSDLGNRLRLELLYRTLRLRRWNVGGFALGLATARAGREVSCGQVV